MTGLKVIKVLVVKGDNLIAKDFVAYQLILGFSKKVKWHQPNHMGFLSSKINSQKVIVDVVAHNKICYFKRDLFSRESVDHSHSKQFIFSRNLNLETISFNGSL